MIRLDYAHNIDIDRTGEPDEKAKRGHAIAAAMDAAMKAASSVYDVRSDTDEKKKEEEEKKDAEGDTLDRILKCLDSFTGKLDSLGSRMDS